jgi:hypothetical protein
MSAPQPAPILNLATAHLERFRYLKISEELLAAHGIRDVTNLEARQFGIQYRGDLGGILYPCWGADGTPKGYRVRRDNPEIENGKPKAKYVQSVDRPHLFFEKTSRQWLSDTSVPVVFVEAYTSALAIAALMHRTKERLLVVAMGGCWGWHGTVGKTENEKGVRVDEKGPTPDLAHIAFSARKTIICLDANVESNPAVQAAERALKRELENRGAIVHLARIPAQSGVNGPDDYIARSSDEAFLQILDDATCEAWPAVQPVRTELSPVRPMPAEIIPDSLKDFLTDITRRMQCPLDFVAVGAIVVLSSVIGAGCGIRPKRRDDWLVIPNLWSAVVGPPSLMLKSPALAEVMRPLNRLETEAIAKHKGHWKSYEAEVEMFNARKEAIKRDMKSAASGKNDIDEHVAKNDYASLKSRDSPHAGALLVMTARLRSYQKFSVKTRAASFYFVTNWLDYSLPGTVRDTKVTERFSLRDGKGAVATQRTVLDGERSTRRTSASRY